jgi:hypothetical protein
MLKDKISKTNWADLVFLAEANKEGFEELKITTLKSHYEDEVYARAWQLIKNEDELETRARIIMESGEIQVREFIKSNEKCEIEVCIDHPQVEDNTVEEVLDLLAEIGIKPNMHVEFGPKMSYTYEEMWKHNNPYMRNQIYSYQKGPYAI